MFFSLTIAKDLLIFLFSLQGNSCTTGRNPNCNVCNKVFSSFKEVMEHLKNEHSTWCSSQQEFVCDICSKKYQTKDSLKKHRKKIHKLNETVLKEKTNDDDSDCRYKKNLICAECKLSFKSKQQIVSHIENEHKVPIKIENIQFDSNEAFQKWKSQIEKCSLTKFVKLNSRTFPSGKKSITFICHRAGKSKQNSEGERHPKERGSNKSGYFCTAYIEL